MSLNYNPDFPPYAQAEYQEYLKNDTYQVCKNPQGRYARCGELFFNGEGVVVIPRKYQKAVNNLVCAEDYHGILRTPHQPAR